MNGRYPPSHASRGGRLDYEKQARSHILLGMPGAVVEVVRECVYAPGCNRIAGEDRRGEEMRSKYGNRKTVVNGLQFDSQAEASRYSYLVVLERAGVISELRRQVPIEIAPGVKIRTNPRKSPAIRYVADFVYRKSDGNEVVEDVKGDLTPIYKLKRHLLALQGIHINEVQAT